MFRHTCLTSHPWPCITDSSAAIPTADVTHGLEASHITQRKGAGGTEGIQL